MEFFFEVDHCVVLFRIDVKAMLFRFSGKPVNEAELRD